jgi:mRNA-degrading endonuclease RelE of RelBE toxin-antitoxin system
VPTYQVQLHRDAGKALLTLPEHIRNAVRECIEQVLQVKPLARVPGKSKQLKGRLAGILQYDLPSGYRLWYRVDQSTQTVLIIYIGPHP